MNFSIAARSLGIALIGFALSSCAVDQNLSQDASGSDSAVKKKSNERVSSLAEKRQADRELRAKERKEALALKEKKDAEKRALAQREAREKREKKAEDARKLAQERADRDERKRAFVLQEFRDVEEIRARREAGVGGYARNREVPAVAERTGLGFFSRMAVSTPSKYKSKGHNVKVNHHLLGSLTPTNAKIEIDLSEQKARVYKVAEGQRQVVIETRVSTGKSGHSTPTGTYRISEKLVEKRSSLYGTWLDSSGQTVPSSGEVGNRPAGATTFVGAEMPYWMRINGGIGMHIGYVPNGPASHGCIRVPSSVQPLIYSKVGVGTTVSVIN
jgi:lipoprotein-anchoring transpeptidase ErfK/SrfK